MDLTNEIQAFNDAMLAINSLLDDDHQVHEILVVSDNGVEFTPWMNWTNQEQREMHDGDYFMALAVAINANTGDANMKLVGINNMEGSRFDFGFSNNLHTDLAGKRVEYVVVGNNLNGTFEDLEILPNWTSIEPKLVACFNEFIDSLHKKRMET